jgi:competence ComEA-like helix-hairpin-helix protein
MTQVVCGVTLVLLCSPQAMAQGAVTGLVNINEAPAKQLALLPGIGTKKAERIVTYRARRKFKRTVELARVRGIGLKTVRRLKTFLRVHGPSTLKRTDGTRGRKR